MNSILRDQVIEKCSSKKLSARSLRQPNLTLEAIVDMSRAHEMAESQARQIEEDSVKPRPDNFKVNKLGFQPQSSGFPSKKGGRGENVTQTHRPRPNFVVSQS